MKKIIPNEVMLPQVARLIEEGHTVTIITRGNSMNPFLMDRRDKITLSAFTPQELQPGVVVLARDLNGHIVFHRIIRREGNNLTLQGDGNLVQTEDTTVAQVMGIMIQAIRKGKTYSTHGKVWRFYSWCWLRLTPLRRWLLALFRRI